MIELDLTPLKSSTTIRVIGVGGAGGNAVNTMIERGIDGVEFIVANTDIMDLRKSKAKIKLQIGEKLTKGHGGGANPAVGQQAAVESREQIIKAIEGADMLFISAGLGGGTGTGAAPVIAEYAKEMGILTLAIVTKPLEVENHQRIKNYELGLSNLRKFVDSYIVIPNDKMAEIDQGTGVFALFKKADSVIYDAAKAMSDIINKSGYMNVDFADAKTVMADMGYAVIGSCVCEGENRAEQAAKGAISNPLLSSVNLKGCKTLLLNVTLGNDALYDEFVTVCKTISQETGSSTNTIIGLVEDEEMEGKICVSVFASGLDGETNTNTGIPHFIHVSKGKDQKQINIGALLQAPSNNKENKTFSTGSSGSANNFKEEVCVPSFMQKFRE